MALSPGTKLKLVAVLLSNLGVVFIIVSCATNHWSHVRDSRMASHQGLWYECSTPLNSTQGERCLWVFERHFAKSGLFVAITMLLLSCGILQATSVLASVCSHYAQYEVVRFLFILEMMTGILSMTAYMLYYHWTATKMHYLDWSHYLGLAGAAMVMIGAVLILLGHEKPKLLWRRY